MVAAIQETMTGSALMRRLEAIIESLPKEGYKAAVVVGLVGRILSLVEEVNELARLGKCIAEAKGACNEKTGLCDPKCGGIIVLSGEDGVVVSKYKNNAFSAKASNTSVSIATKETKMTIEGGLLTLSLPTPSGDYMTISIDLSDPGQVYENNYSIKYVIRRIGKPLRASQLALRTCASSRAIVC